MIGRVTESRYLVPIRLARLLLRGLGLDLGTEFGNVTGVLFDMNKVFEDFAFAALSETLRTRDRILVANANGQEFFLAANREVKLEPDLSAWDRAGVADFVADLKYKDLDAKGVPNADVFQMLGYILAAKLSTGTLIYVGSKRLDRRIRIPSAGIQIAIRCIDLNAPFSDVMSRIEEIGVELIDDGPAEPVLPVVP